MGLTIAHDNSEMTAAQRQCLLHVLRNSAAALEGFILFLEDSNGLLTHDDIVTMLNPVCGALKQVVEANLHESFCPLGKEQCSFVAPFVGCAGNPVPFKRN